MAVGGVASPRIVARGAVCYKKEKYIKIIPGGVSMFFSHMFFKIYNNQKWKVSLI
jgi:hypothetical protein